MGAHAFSNNELFIFYCNTVIRRVFEEKERFGKKEGAGKVSFFSWLATHQWKNIIEKCNSVGPGTHKVGKAVSFRPKVDTNLPNTWSVWKG